MENTYHIPILLRNTMLSKILTSHVASIDDFVHNPHRMLSNTKDGIIAIFTNNVPAFYAISSQRLEKLLELEARFRYSTNNIISSNQFYEKPITYTTTVPIGKFAMYSSWKPDLDFHQKAAIWGIQLTQRITVEELAAFVAYWQVEEKVFHHVQWQQKLARSLQIRRANNKKSKRNINTLEKTDDCIPSGFIG